MRWDDPHTWISLNYASEWFIRLTMLVVVPFRRSPMAAKGWLLLIFFFPWPGLIVYWLIGSPKAPIWRQKKLLLLRPDLLRLARRLREGPNVIQPQLGTHLDQAVTLARNLGHLPILGGNSAELLSDYYGIIDRLIADIDAAKDHVHLLFYIFEDDTTGQRVIDALAGAARRGVHCRVMMDALGTGRWTVRRLLKKFAAVGVAAYPALPIGLLRGRFDLRNHRKIAVIDGRIGYTGSQNIVNSDFKKGLTYEEMMVRVTGSIVLMLQWIFIIDWYLESDQVLDGVDVFPEPELTGNVPLQLLPSGPGYVTENNPTENNQRMFLAMVHGARERVVITTPYFVPDEALLQALQTAVLRGVEVHLVVCKKADQVLVSLAQRSYYEELLEARVRIHLYEARFLHAKHISIDGDLCLIGSSNMDIRSFQLNAEISLLLYDAKLTSLLHAEQERYFAGSELLTLEVWRSRARIRRLLENLARLFSPLL